MKLVVVTAIVVLLAAARVAYARYKASLQNEKRPHPPLPAELRNAATERTWVVFTTPLCASCGPVKEKLASADPDAHLVTIDATREPHLADAFHVRSAPTVLLADAAGNVEERLVGVEAVDRYLATV